MKNEQYNEFIQKQLDDNEERYFADIEHNKNAVWEKIEERLEKKKIIPLWFYSIAALILLLVGFGFIFYLQLERKDRQIFYLQSQLSMQQNELSRLKMSDNQVITKIDTVRVEHKAIVYVPVKMKEKIIEYDTITSVVKVTDTVFIKEQAPALLAEKENEKDAYLVDNNIVNVNELTKKKNRVRRFIFLFGRPKTERQPDYESERLFTLKSK